MLLGCMGAARGDESQAVRHVLLLHSYHAGMDWTDDETAGLRKALAASPSPVELYVEYMDAKRVFDAIHFDNLRRLLQHKYAHTPLDAVVVADNDAFAFARDFRHALFPDRPLVFLGINSFHDGMLTGMPGVTGVAETFDGAATLALMLRLHPQARRVILLSDDTTTGQAVRAELEPALYPFRERAVFEHWYQFSFAELERRLAALPADSLVLLLPVATDRDGAYLSSAELARRVSRASPVPVYGAWGFYLGHGIVGGYLTNARAQGMAAGEALLRVLQGEAVQRIPVRRDVHGEYAFDYRQLARFGISTVTLPMEARILNQPWHIEYKALLWFSGFIGLLLLGLSLGLAFSMRRRRRADEALRRNMAVLLARDQALSEISQGVLVCDGDGRITYVNHALETITGHFERALLGLSVASVLGLDEAQERARVQATAVDAVPGSVEYLCPRQDGSHFWCELSVTAVRDLGGRLAQRVYVLRDISERKRVESELRIAAVAFASQAGMMVTDPQGVILRVNAAFERMTGYAAAEVVGRSPDFLRSDHHDDAFYAALRTGIEQQGLWQGVIWNRCKDGSVRAEWLTLVSVQDEAGRVTHHVGTFTDVLQNESAEAEAHRLAYYDPLTRLPNRRLLHERLRQSLAMLTLEGGRGALFLLDLDNFKAVNDTRSHDSGDRMLIEVARRLRHAVAEPGTVARLAGDEFVVLLGGADETLAAQLGERLRKLLAEPFQLNGHERLCTASIGIALFAAGDEPDIVLKSAETAMYQAKQAGRNTLRFFDQAEAAALTERNALDNDLHFALRRNELLLHYQPKVDAHGRVVGAEALLRWQHATRGLVSPAEFIPLAEASELILPIGHWVLEQACRQLARWQQAGGRLAGLHLAINVSSRQFRQAGFVAQVEQALAQCAVEPSRLTLELTESLVLDDVEGAITRMQALRRLGVELSMDDFGTGYSSLAYLTRLPLDELKIDRSFVRKLPGPRSDEVIAQSIIGMGCNLGLTVVAEGVEREVQREFLFHHGCHQYQGYLFSAPLTLDAFEALLVGDVQVASPDTQRV